MKLFKMFEPKGKEATITILPRSDKLPKHWCLSPITNKKGFQCYINDNGISLKTIQQCPICKVYYLDILLNEYYQSTLYQEN